MAESESYDSASRYWFRK